MTLVSPAIFYCSGSLSADRSFSAFWDPEAHGFKRFKYIELLTQFELSYLAVSVFLVSHIDNLTKMTLVRFPAVAWQFKKM